MTFRLFLMLTALAIIAGCNSISSTMLTRLETDDFVGNSNGNHKRHCQTRPYKGVPITLRVPTHVDVAIEEKVRFSLDTAEQQVYRLESDPTHRHLSVYPSLIYTDKVFTVDVKRPAAGTADYTMQFGSESDAFDNRQYFSALKSRIVDETIEDVTTAIESVFGAISAASDGGSKTGVQDDQILFFEQTRTVAWKRFDLDAVDFEQQVAAFVEQHINGCNTCAEYHHYPITHSSDPSGESSDSSSHTNSLSAALPDALAGN